MLYPKTGALVGQYFVTRRMGGRLGNGLQKLIMNISARGGTIVLLIPARTDTSYFHDYILGKAEIRFLRGRLKFEDEHGNTKEAAPFPSMIVIYR